MGLHTALERQFIEQRLALGFRKIAPFIEYGGQLDIAAGLGEIRRCRANGKQESGEQKLSSIGMYWGVRPALILETGK